ncbi:MAG: cyclic nucleotide-binding domain-containing protein, partial [Leptospiraceae bacterium]|nr:cyclic nucleotide-binding domain-containing protein [Leptospiraceae bacterium]
MHMDQLGEYLVRKGVISTAQLIEALEQQRRATENLSLFAVSEGFIPPEDLERIIAHQLESGESFEEALLSLHVFSPERLAEFRRIKRDFRVPLGEVLIRRRYLTRAELQKWIERYENQIQDRSRLIDVLSAIDIFQNAEKNLLTALAERAHAKNYQSGDAIYRAGDEGDSIYVIESGLVRLTASEPGLERALEIGIIRSGEHFGLSAIISQTDRVENAHALVDTQCWRLPAEDLKAVIAKDPVFLAALNTNLSRDLHTFTRSVTQPDAELLHDSNIYTIIFDCACDENWLMALLAEVRKQLSGTIQVLHNHAHIDLPFQLDADYFKTYSNSNDISPEAAGKMFALQIPQLSVEDNFHKILRWLHTESQHCDALIFLYFSNGHSKTRLEAEQSTASGDPAGSGRSAIEMLTQSSRRSLVFIDRDEPPAFCRRLRENRDRIYLIESGDRDRDYRRYMRLLHAYPLQLAPLTFHKKHLSESCARAIRGLLHREIAVVLGGGGAKASAHIGVLAVLAEAGIPIDLATGCSSGSVVGALWAYGYEID